MKFNESRVPWWKRLVLATLILGSIGVVGLYATVHILRPDEPPHAAAPISRLRMSGPQFVLNWQSFPGREVVVEHCTILVAPNSEITCRVIDGAREMGAIGLDAATLSPADIDWARRTCATPGLSRSCSSRVVGVIRRGSDGRPILDQASIER